MVGMEAAVGGGTDVGLAEAGRGEDQEGFGGYKEVAGTCCVVHHAGICMMLRPFAEKKQSEPDDRTIHVACICALCTHHNNCENVCRSLCSRRLRFSCLGPFEAQHDGAVHSSCHCCATQEEQEVWSLTAEKGAVGGVG